MPYNFSRAICWATHDPLFERGVYLPIVAGLIISLTLVIAVIIDIGFLYKARTDLQAALDAGAVFGGGAMLQTVTSPALEAQTLEVVRENLRYKGFPANIVNSLALGGMTHPALQVNSSLAPLEIALDAQIDQETMLLDFIPGVAATHLIAASATAKNIRFEVVLVFDCTESMHAKLPVSMHSCPSCVTKLDAAKFAATSFVNQLFSFDRLAIVQYCQNGGSNLSWGQHATVIHSMQQVTNNRASIINKIQAIQATNADTTNTASGLWRARGQFPPSLAPDIQRFVILLTDGVPYGYNRPPTDPFAGAACPDISNNLLTDLLPPLNPNNPDHDYRLRYLDAIRQADLLRQSKNATVYTVGFGIEDSDLSDPYQNYQQSAWGGDIKNLLMERMANDHSRALSATALPIPPWPSPGPTYHFQDFPCVGAISQQQSLPMGKYYLAGDGEELLDAFLEISKNKIHYRTYLVE